MCSGVGILWPLCRGLTFACIIYHLLWQSGLRREGHSAAAGAFFFAGAKKKQMSVSEFIRPRKKIKMTRIKSTWRLRKMAEIYCAPLRQTKLTIKRWDFYWAIVRVGFCTTLGPFAVLRSTA
ncbi:hypothetical protein DCM91_01455 [Chitinophaga costaii]|nr:hypothetical protein DCM91_01455 [Chitinophaga costaii]